MEAGPAEATRPNTGRGFSAASTVAENNSQLLKPGTIARVDSSAAINWRFVVALNRSRSAVGARSIPCARNAASTSGWRSRVKFRTSGDAGSTAEATARRARSPQRSRTAASPYRPMAARSTAPFLPAGVRVLRDGGNGGNVCHTVPSVPSVILEARSPPQPPNTTRPGCARTSRASIRSRCGDRSTSGSADAGCRTSSCA